MKIHIDNAVAIGKVVRASRKAKKIRQDDAASSIGVSENFHGKIERGNESMQRGKLFQVLEGLGVRVMVDVSESVATYLNDPASSKDKPKGRSLRASINQTKAGVHEGAVPLSSQAISL